MFGMSTNRSAVIDEMLIQDVMSQGKDWLTVDGVESAHTIVHGLLSSCAQRQAVTKASKGRKSL